MYVEETRGVRITVKPSCLEGGSDPDVGRYV